MLLSRVLLSCLILLPFTLASSGEHLVASQPEEKTPLASIQREEKAVAAAPPQEEKAVAASRRPVRGKLTPEQHELVARLVHSLESPKFREFGERKRWEIRIRCQEFVIDLEHLSHAGEIATRIVHEHSHEFESLCSKASALAATLVAMDIPGAVIDIIQLVPQAVSLIIKVVPEIVEFLRTALPALGRIIRETIMIPIDMVRHVKHSIDRFICRVDRRSSGRRMGKRRIEYCLKHGFDVENGHVKVDPYIHLLPAPEGNHQKETRPVLKDAAVAESPVENKKDEAKPQEKVVEDEIERKHTALEKGEVLEQVTRAGHLAQSTASSNNEMSTLQSNTVVTPAENPSSSVVDSVV